MDQSWRCYHHPIAFTEIKELLEEEVQAVRQFIHADLQEIYYILLIRYYINTSLEVMKHLPKCNRYKPSNQYEKDECIEMLMDELSFYEE